MVYLAQSMQRAVTRKNTAKRICFIGQMRYPSHRDKYAGVIQYVSEHDEYDVQQFDFSMFQPHICTALLKQLRPDGIIFGNDEDIWRFSRFRAKSPCKVVVCDHVGDSIRPAPDAMISVDRESAAQFIADLYLKRGLAHFAYIGYDKTVSDWISLNNLYARSSLREKAFCNRIARAGGSCSVLRISGSGTEDETARIAAWLKELPKPCGLMAYWDPLGKTGLDTCRRAGIRVPEQLCVIATDNDVPLCESTRPPLSSVDLMFRDLGYAAAETLVQLINGKKPTAPAPRIRFRFCERASSLDLKGSARIVAAAREIIRKQARQGLTTSELARQMHISPRTLEFRFAEVLGIPPREEILRHKLAAVQDLLISTRLPNGAIAEQCGFSTNNLVNLFKKRFGCSMRKFRNRAHP